jgi:ribosomal protein S18 acetylase RimI-like enzyme
MTAPLHIIRAEHEHLPLLAPLFDAYRVFYQQPSDVMAAHAYLQERLSNLESVIFLAQAGDKAAGFTQLYPSFTSVGLQRIWILYDLFVAPDARRQGVGRALLARAHEWTRAGGAQRVELSTAVDNLQAQALYESMGYTRDEQFYTYQLLLK